MGFHCTMYYILPTRFIRRMLCQNPEDRYQLRKLQMDVDKRGLELQKVQQDLERSVLEMEHKYELIGGTKIIDPRTATIKDTPATRSGNGKVQAEELKTVVVEVDG